MKFCKDCKWVRDIEQKPYGWECSAPQIKKGTKLLTGIPLEKLKYCEDSRSGGFLFSRLDNVCGKSGRWFKLRD